MLLTDELLSKLWGACQRRCFGTFEPEELYSLTLLRVTRSFDTFKGGEFQAWVMTVMVSVWKNEIRARSLRPEGVPMPDSMLEGWDPHVDSGYVLEDDVITEYSPEIQAALEQLFPVQRQAFLLYVHGFSHREIAKVLGLGAVGTSCSMVKRARVKMQRVLREHLDGGAAGTLRFG